jgi:hypothetical protein
MEAEGRGSINTPATTEQITSSVEGFTALGVYRLLMDDELIKEQVILDHLR